MLYDQPPFARIVLTKTIAFSQSKNKFFFLKTDIVKLSCDLKNLTAILTCERNGKVNSLTLRLNECFRVSHKLNESSVSTILEINLLDSESYHVVEELKVSNSSTCFSFHFLS